MKLEVYDFDGTIYDGDSTIDFIKFLTKRKKSIILHYPKMALYFLKYKLKLIKKETMKECFFEIFKKFKNIDEEIELFWKTHKKNIKDFYNDKETHKNDIIASASQYFLLDPIAKEYKIKKLFASPVNKNNGKYNGVNCHNVEKVRLINKEYPNAIIETMYSDDINADKPLLELAKKSYVVINDKIYDYKEYKTKKNNFFKIIYKKICNIYSKNQEIINYLIVGFLTTLVSLITYYIITKIFLNPKNATELQLANIISWITSVIFAYITNRKYVFKSKNKKVLKECTTFITSRILTLILDMVAMFLIVTIFKYNDKIGKLISQILVIIGNYIISKLLVFKDDKSNK